MNIAVLLTCHNRKNNSISCLEALDKNMLTKNCLLDIYLVDDGSTDGTSDAIKRKFPHVNIIQGDGNLFWNGGMRLAWTKALENDFDFYIWLNDDSILYSDAVLKIISSYEKLINIGENVGALLGTMVDPVSNIPTYGGRSSVSRINPLKFGSLIEPSDEPQKCDFINGNFTLIPKKSVKKIGILSEIYTHSIGDFDYGLRLQKAGMTCWVAPGFFGECEGNSLSGGCKDNSLSISDRVDKMQRLSQLPPVNEWMYYVRLHGGYIWPVLYFKAWIRGKFPSLWVIMRSKNV